MYYIKNRDGIRIAEAEVMYLLEEIEADLCTDDDLAGLEGKFREYNNDLEPGDERKIVWERSDATEIVVGYLGFE